MTQKAHNIITENANNKKRLNQLFHDTFWQCFQKRPLCYPYGPWGPLWGPLGLHVGRRYPSSLRHVLSGLAITTSGTRSPRVCTTSSADGGGSSTTARSPSGTPRAAPASANSLLSRWLENFVWLCTSVKEKLTSVFVGVLGELLELQCQRGPGIRDGPGRQSRPQAIWEMARRPLLRGPTFC